MANVRRLAGIVILGVGLVLHIVGLATPEWSKLTNNDSFISYGLWKVCGGSSYGTLCYDIPTKPSELEVCEAFALIGMILGVGALGLALFTLLKANQNQMLSVISAGCCLVAFASVLVTVIVWGVKIHPNDYVIGYSFILSIIGGVLMVIAGPLFILASRQVSLS